MSAPTILYPRDGDAGFYLDGYLVATKAPTEDQREVHWQVAETDDFPSTDPLWDSDLREPDGVTHFADEVWIPVERFKLHGAEAGATVYLGCMTRLTDDTESDWSSVLITFGTARCTREKWTRAQ